LSALTPERLCEIERHVKSWCSLDAERARPVVDLGEILELVRGYRAGLAAERELAAARVIVEYAQGLIIRQPELEHALDAYDAARKGEG